MSRNWLRSSLLPSNYWWFAIKQAAGALNAYPTTTDDNTFTTPFELAFNLKPPDYRNLLPMFSTVYIKKVCNRGLDHNKWYPQSLKCILEGKCFNSDALLFYHPPLKQTISCTDGYKLDTFLPPGQNSTSVMMVHLTSPP